MSAPIVLDLETKKTLQETKGDISKLGVSIVGIYDYAKRQYYSFFENQLNRLFPLLEKASVLIGFNIKNFDLPVLNSYYIGNLTSFPILDLLEEIKTSFGRRLALDDLVRETLGVKKSGHGLLAINYYRDKNFDKLKKYCLHDVELTQQLYEYGKKHGRLFYRGSYGREEIKVNWDKNGWESEDINLTLPI